MNVKRQKRDTSKLPARARKTAKAQSPASADTNASNATVKASKYKGATTGLRVMEYQDRTFADNVNAMKTDEELAAMWRAELPQAVAFTAFHVKGARRDYNAGRHSKGAAKPATPLAEVAIVDNRRQFATEVKAETKSAPAKSAAKRGGRAKAA